MDRKNRFRLAFSILLSFLIWGGLVNWKFALVAIPAILFHEYGHYYWMGREGIKKRRMMMIPPLGAMAMAGEPWPSREAEARIALAGPTFGFIFLLGAFLFVPTAALLAGFIGYMLYVDFNFYRSGPKMLAEARSLLEKLSNIEKQFHSEEVKAELIDAAFTKAGLGSVSDKNQKTLEEGIKRLELVASPLNMRPEAIVGYSLFFVGLNLAYLFLFSRLSSNFWKVLGMI